MSDNQTTKFAITPQWVLFSEISDRAKVLFGVLQSHLAGKDGSTAYPSRKRLAELLNCSTDSVDRAIKELRDLGAIETTTRTRDDGSMTSNEHRLFFDPPTSTPVQKGLSEEADPPLGKTAEGSGRSRPAQNKTHSTRPRNDQDKTWGPPQNESDPRSYSQNAIAHWPQIARKVTEALLNEARSPDGHRLSSSEKRKLKQDVTEWLVDGYSFDAVLAAINASDYKTPAAVGGQLRIKAKPNAPKSWNDLGYKYEQALREEAAKNA